MYHNQEFFNNFKKVLYDIKTYFKNIKKICNKCYKIKNINLYRKHRSICKECDKKSRQCIHNKDKNTCKQCGNGGSICEHFKTRSECKTCGSKRFCEHNIRKSNCRDCNGINICIHNKFKTSCKKCKGGSICIHEKVRSICIICTPNTKKYCINCRTLQDKKSNNYLCSYCNPNKKHMYKIKELKLKNWLDNNNFDIIYNKRCKINNNKYMFPDFVIDCNAFYIIIECDELRHKSYIYNEERNRENNICIAFNLPCVFIRFNHDNKKFNESVKLIILKSYIDYYKSLNYCENELKFLFY